MAEWFIQIFGIFQPMSDWESKTFEDAIEKGHHEIEYFWAYQEGDEKKMWEYSIDLVTMTQTNKTADAVRRLSSFDETITDCVTSPYPSMQIAPAPTGDPPMSRQTEE